MLGLMPAVAGGTGKNLQAYTSTKNAGSGSNYNTGGNAWTQPGAITASDDTRAICAIGTGVGTVTQTLRAKSFGFAIPAGAIIDGIEVTIERRMSVADDCNDNKVILLKAGAQYGNNKASATTWPSTDTDATYGGASDLWGGTWTAADINNANFGVDLRVENGQTANTTAYVDRIKIKVYYRA